MALDTTTKQAIKAKLRLGSSPKDVSDQFAVGLQTVYAIHKTVKEEQASEQVTDLHSIPPEIITHVVEEAKKELPLPIPGSPAPLTEAFDAVVAGAEGLKKLDSAFQTTMQGVLKRFDTMLLERDLPLKDVILISNTTASAYEKIFAAGTNIHIGDNNSHSTQQLSVFQNKKGI